MSLLAGLAVITVPIMLHLFGQKQPQLIDFPALRFVRETRQEQSSSWQLRHFLLLLLRILLLAALALALARPRVHSAMMGSVLGVSTIGILAVLASLIAAVAFVSKRPLSISLTCAVIALALWATAGLWGVQSFRSGPSVPSSDTSSPIAAAIIVDNGPSMSYKAENQTRLEAGKEMATWILDQLPIDSRVGVLSGVPVGSLALDPSTAKSQVKNIEIRGSHVDLLSRIHTALDLVLANELERKEIYVVTDLMGESWNAVQSDLIDLLNEHKDEVLVQIIDVGEPEVTNWQLGDVESDANSVAVGGSVAFTVRVNRLLASAAKKSKPVTVELWQEEINTSLPVVVNETELQLPKSRKVSQQVIDLSSSNSVSVELRSAELTPAGTHHFTIKLDQNDPLLIDNQRFATVIAREQQPTLIVADNLVLGEQLKLLVDISGARAADGTAIVDAIRFVQLPQVQLEKYAVICLLDPPPLAPNIAQSLKEYVLGGGGLLSLLGPELEKAKGNAIEGLLPGKPLSVLTRDRTERTAFTTPLALTHPIFQEVSAIADEVPWFLFPVFSSWTFESLVDGAIVVATLNDGSSPLVIAHDLGRGQIITVTTPIPETEVRGRNLWNEMWVGSDPWPAYGLLLGCFQTLSGADQANLNFKAGAPVSLSNDAFTWPSRYEMFMPNAETRRPPDAAAGLLNVGQIDQPGIYRLRGNRGQPVSRGFSVNVTADDTQLVRLDALQTDERLGEGNYRIARSQDEVESSVGQARFGRELYPLLMVLVAGLFLAEQAMSNRFYNIKFSGAKRTGLKSSKLGDG
jgi:hypothetical protein